MGLERDGVAPPDTTTTTTTTKEPGNRQALFFCHLLSVHSRAAIVASSVS